MNEYTIEFLDGSPSLVIRCDAFEIKDGIAFFYNETFLNHDYLIGLVPVSPETLITAINFTALKSISKNRNEDD